MSIPGRNQLFIHKSKIMTIDMTGFSDNHPMFNCKVKAEDLVYTTHEGDLREHGYIRSSQVDVNDIDNVWTIGIRRGDLLDHRRHSNDALTIELINETFPTLIRATLKTVESCTEVLINEEQLKVLWFNLAMGDKSVVIEGVKKPKWFSTVAKPLITPPITSGATNE